MIIFNCAVDKALKSAKMKMEFHKQYQRKEVMNIIEIVLNQVTATTKTQKTASKLITKMTVEINSTGQKLVNTTATKKNTKSNVMIKAINNTNKKLAAFSTHEACGKTNVVKYKAEIF